MQLQMSKRGIETVCNRLDQAGVLYQLQDSQTLLLQEPLTDQLKSYIKGVLQVERTL